jgi:hypothetical protein
MNGDNHLAQEVRTKRLRKLAASDDPEVRALAYEVKRAHDLLDHLRVQAAQYRTGGRELALRTRIERALARARVRAR